MEKGKDEDEMLDMTLKAVEMVNIADIAIEREQLQADCEKLLNIRTELEKTEDDMHKEKLKEKFKDKGNRDARKKVVTAKTNKNSLTINKQSTSGIVDVAMMLTPSLQGSLVNVVDL